MDQHRPPACATSEQWCDDDNDHQSPTIRKARQKIAKSKKPLRRMSTRFLLLLFAFVVVACVLERGPSSQYANAFAPPTTISRTVTYSGQQSPLGAPFVSTTTSLSMAKKRRRRKDAPGGDAASSSSPAPADPASADDDDGIVAGSGSDLPDFDLVEEVEEKSKPKPKRKISTNPDEITDAMRGTADAPVRSVSELLQDRQLEKAMVFDESEIDTDIPDFTELAKKSMSGDVGGGIEAGMGKKKAKQAARKAAAIEAKALEEEGAGITDALKNIPGITNDSGDVAFNKVRCLLAHIRW